MRPKYPEYEHDAVFRCSEGCGSFSRDRCYTSRGRLICPRCRYIGTLVYVPQEETK